MPATPRCATRSHARGRVDGDAEAKLQIPRFTRDDTVLGMTKGTPETVGWRLLGVAHGPRPEVHRAQDHPGRDLARRLRERRAARRGVSRTSNRRSSDGAPRAASWRSTRRAARRRSGCSSVTARRGSHAAHRPALRHDSRAPKRSAESYAAIARALNIPASALAVRLRRRRRARRGARRRNGDAPLRALGDAPSTISPIVRSFDEL